MKDATFMKSPGAMTIFFDHLLDRAHWYGDRKVTPIGQQQFEEKADIEDSTSFDSFFTSDDIISLVKRALREHNAYQKRVGRYTYTVTDLNTVFGYKYRSYGSTPLFRYKVAYKIIRRGTERDIIIQTAYPTTHKKKLNA